MKRSTARLIIRSVAFSLTVAFALCAHGGMNNDRFESVLVINGDANTYYPVVFAIPGGGSLYDLHIGRTFNSMAPSTWYSATHKGGLTFHVKVANMQWGGNPAVVDIQKYEVTYAKQIAKVEYTAHGYKVAVWMRGGGAAYNVSGTLPGIATPQICLSAAQTFDHATAAHDTFVEPTTIASLDTIDFGNGRGALLVAPGVASNPTISFTADQNTGLFSSASDTMSITTNGVERIRFDAQGNIGIGTTTPANALDVNGTIRAKEVIVATDWPDYVFEEGYRLRSLSEVEAHIVERGHLPGVPSAEEVAASGVSIGDSQRLLLEKIEELTLYVIELKKENARLQSESSENRERLMIMERAINNLREDAK